MSRDLILLFHVFLGARGLRDEGAKIGWDGGEGGGMEVVDGEMGNGHGYGLEK